MDRHIWDQGAEPLSLDYELNVRLTVGDLLLLCRSLDDIPEARNLQIVLEGQIPSVREERYRVWAQKRRELPY